MGHQSKSCNLRDTLVISIPSYLLAASLVDIGVGDTSVGDICGQNLCLRESHSLPKIINFPGMSWLQGILTVFIGNVITLVRPLAGHHYLCICLSLSGLSLLHHPPSNGPTAPPPNRPTAFRSQPINAAANGFECTPRHKVRGRGERGIRMPSPLTLYTVVTQVRHSVPGPCPGVLWDQRSACSLALEGAGGMRVVWDPNLDWRVGWQLVVGGWGRLLAAVGDAAGISSKSLI